MWNRGVRGGGGGWWILLTSCLLAPYSEGAVRRKHETAYVVDPIGIPLPKPSHVPSEVGSPVTLIQPDRYEFYTFDESGELIKRLMTLREIQEIIATGDGDDAHVLTVAQSDLSKPAVTFNFQPPSHTKVHTIVSNVQNVLKAEMEAQKVNPPKENMFDTPDVSSSWSMILPAIFGNTGGSIAPDSLISMHSVPETDVITNNKDQTVQSNIEAGISKPNEQATEFNLDKNNDDPDDIENDDNVYSQVEDLIEEELSKVASKETDSIILNANKISDVSKETAEIYTKTEINTTPYQKTTEKLSQTTPKPTTVKTSSIDSEKVIIQNEGTSKKPITQDNMKPVTTKKTEQSTLKPNLSPVLLITKQPLKTETNNDQTRKPELASEVSYFKTTQKPIIPNPIDKINNDNLKKPILNTKINETKIMSNEVPLIWRDTVNLNANKTNSIAEKQKENIGQSDIEKTLPINKINDKISETSSNKNKLNSSLSENENLKPESKIDITENTKDVNHKKPSLSVTDSSQVKETHENVKNTIQINTDKNIKPIPIKTEELVKTTNAFDRSTTEKEIPKISDKPVRTTTEYIRIENPTKNTNPSKDLITMGSTTKLNIRSTTPNIINQSNTSEHTTVKYIAIEENANNKPIKNETKNQDTLHETQQAKPIESLKPILTTLDEDLTTEKTKKPTYQFIDNKLVANSNNDSTKELITNNQPINAQETANKKDEVISESSSSQVNDEDIVVTTYKPLIISVISATTPRQPDKEYVFTTENSIKSNKTSINSPELVTSTEQNISTKKTTINIDVPKTKDTNLPSNKLQTHKQNNKPSSDIGQTTLGDTFVKISSSNLSNLDENSAVKNETDLKKNSNPDIKPSVLLITKDPAIDLTNANTSTIQILNHDNFEPDIINSLNSISIDLNATDIDRNQELNKDGLIESFTAKTSSRPLLGIKEKDKIIVTTESISNNKIITKNEIHTKPEPLSATTYGPDVIRNNTASLLTESVDKLDKLISTTPLSIDKTINMPDKIQKEKPENTQSITKPLIDNLSDSITNVLSQIYYNSNSSITTNYSNDTKDNPSDLKVTIESNKGNVKNESFVTQKPMDIQNVTKEEKLITEKLKNATLLQNTETIKQTTETPRKNTTTTEPIISVSQNNFADQPKVKDTLKNQNKNKLSLPENTTRKQVTPTKVITEKTVSVTKHKQPQKVISTTEKTSERIKTTSTGTTTAGITDSTSITEDDELMEMLNQYSQMYKSSVDINYKKTEGQNDDAEFENILSTTSKNEDVTNNVILQKKNSTEEKISKNSSISENNNTETTKTPSSNIKETNKNDTISVSISKSPGSDTDINKNENNVAHKLTYTHAELPSEKFPNHLLNKLVSRKEPSTNEAPSKKNLSTDFSSTERYVAPTLSLRNSQDEIVNTSILNTTDTTSSLIISSSTTIFIPEAEDSTQKSNVFQNKTVKNDQISQNSINKTKINIESDDPLVSKNSDKNKTNSEWKLIPTVNPHIETANIKSSIKKETEENVPSSQTPTSSVSPLPVNSNKDIQVLKNYQSQHIGQIHLPGANRGEGLEKTTAGLGEDVFQFSQLCNELAFRYWNAVSSNGIDPKRSLAISPFAVTSILAMVFLGARGATSGEMNEILKLDDMVTFNPHIVFKNVTESIEVSKKSGVATSAFIRELYSDRSKGRLLSFYKDRVQQFYSGHVEEVNFKVIGDIIRRRTNLLVKRHTWSKLPEYIKANNMILRPPLSIFSANVFQTDCSVASTDGRDGEMYFVVSPSIRQRRLIPVPAVVYRTGFLAGYVPELDATVVAIDKGDQIVSTIFVMPGQQGSTAQGDDIIDLQKRIVNSALEDNTWTKLLQSLIPRQGLELQIPRFSHRSVINGTAALKTMGLKDLFDIEKADLRGLNGQANDLYLSDLMLVNTFSTCGEGYIGDQHHVEVYPGEPNKIQRRLWRTPHRPIIQDTEDMPTEVWEEPRDYQRAFHDPLHDTSYLLMPLHLRPRQARLPDSIPEPPRLKFDRPFMYFVRHNPTGLILHMGRYNPRLLP